MVARGLAPSREVAQRLVEGGRVLAGGVPVLKPSRLVAVDEPIVVTEPEPFVGRAGAKLDAALRIFDLDVAGKRCADFGAGTGGFTDCLLQHGALEVVAVDVGHGTFHPRLAEDPRVRLLERTDVRDVDAEALGGLVDFVAVDLSFISCIAALDPILRVTTESAAAVVLVKPQFEAGRRMVSKGKGVIRDPEVWRDVLERVVGSLGRRSGRVRGIAPSPIKGRTGNVEFLVCWEPHGRGEGRAIHSKEEVDTAIEAAVSRARDEFGDG